MVFATANHAHLADLAFDVALLVLSVVLWQMQPSVQGNSPSDCGTRRRTLQASFFFSELLIDLLAHDVPRILDLGWRHTAKLSLFKPGVGVDLGGLS